MNRQRGTIAFLLLAIATAMPPLRAAADGGGAAPGGTRSRGTDPGAENLLRLASFRCAPDAGFTENRGQVRGPDGEARPEVLFSKYTAGASMHLLRDRISYVFTRRKGAEDAAHSRAAIDRPAPLFEQYRMDVRLVGANTGARVTATDPSDGHVNFHQGGMEAVTGVRGFSRVVYRNIYPSIDLECAATPRGYKYSFIVRPGGDPAAIGLEFEGATELRREFDGSLVARTPFGEVRDSAPLAYYAGAPRPAQAFFGTVSPERSLGALVPARFTVDGARVGFAIGARDWKRTLVIDPGVYWSTYYGGTNEDWSHRVETDAASNVYVCGETLSDPFPTQAGYQMTNRGSWDAFVIKFNAAGARVWATLFGGGDDDYGYGIAVRSGRVTMCGWTRSANFPVRNAMQSALAGDWDPYLAQFLEDGSLRWSTYFGGSAVDRALDVTADDAGFVAMTGWTFSADYPVLNAQQATIRGSSDLLIAKFDTAGAPLWSTYYGGSANDEGWAIAANSAGAIAVTGRSGSTDFPLANAAQGALAGAMDAVVVLFSPGGQRLWSTFCGGIEEDHGFDVTAAGGTIVAGGLTESKDFPVLNAMQDKRKGLSDGFVTAYSVNGVLTWSTFFGGGGPDYVIGLASDAAGGILLCGSTGSDDLPLLGAVQSEPTGDECFAGRLTPGGLVAWCTYLGGGGNEGASGISSSPDGGVVVCGSTNSFDFPVDYAQQPAYGGGRWDSFVTKLGSCPATALIFLDGPSSICPGGTTRLRANAGSGFSYQWRKDGAKIKDADKVTFVVSDSGSYTVVVTNGAGCSSRSQPVSIRLVVPAVDAGEKQIVCRGDPALLQATPVAGIAPFSYLWSPSGTLDDASSPSPTANPDTTTLYIVTMTDSLGCVSSDSVLVEVDRMEIEAGPPRVICLGEAAHLGVDITEGTAPFFFEWTPVDDLNGSNAPDPLASPGRTTTYHVTVTDGNGCIRRDSVVVQVHRLVISAVREETICPGSSKQLTLDILEGSAPFSFTWGPSEGLSSSAAQRPVAFPAQTTFYEVVVTDANGCTARERVRVQVLPRPVAGIDPGGPVAFCAGDSITLTAAPGHRSYHWSDGRTTRSIVVHRAGEYAVRVIDTLGCEARDTVSVSVEDYPAPRILALRPAVFCEGDSTILDAGGGYARYLWSNGATTRFLVARQSGVFSVRVETGAGCAGTAPAVAVTVHPMPIAAIDGPASVCRGATVRYRAVGPLGLRYTWSAQGGTVITGPDAREITVAWTDSLAGIVTLRVRDDSTGCEAVRRDSVRINAALKPRITPGGLVRVCEGDSAVLDAGAGYAAYAWSTGDSARFIAVRTGGMYTVRVDDGAGCSGRDTAFVAIVPLPAPVLLADRPAYCAGDTAVLTVVSPYAAYRWSTGDTTSSIRVTQPGVYRVAVTDADGCAGESDSLGIAFTSVAAPEIAGDSAVCAGDTVAYSAVSGPGLQHRWAAMNGDIVGSADQPFVRIVWRQGAGQVTLAVEDRVTRCGASSGFAVFARLAETPGFVVGGDSILCEGDSATLTGDTGFAGYAWITPAGRASGRIITVRDAGTYRLEGRDSAGCAGVSRPIDIHVNPRPRIEIEGPPSACIGTKEVYSVALFPGTTCRWTVTGGTLTGLDSGRSVEVQWGGAGAGRLVAIALLGACAGSDTLDVTIGSTLNPVITAAGGTTFCEGDSVLLDAGAGYDTYRWTTGETRRTIVARTGGVYGVTVRDASGCEGSATRALTMRPAPRPVVIGPATLCEGDTIALSTEQPHASYRWNTGDTTRSILVTGGGAFQVFVTDIAGCGGLSAFATVAVVPLPPRPVITRNGIVLRSTPAQYYRWYLNGSEIPGVVADSVRITATGLYTVRITDTNGCTAFSDPYEVLDTQSATAVLSLPDIEAAPGERITIQIKIDSWSNPGGVPVDGFSATLIAHRDLLYPIEGTPAGIVQGSERMIPILLSPADTTGTLAELRFLVMLGPVDTTSLRLYGAVFGPGRVVVTTVPGRLRIAICREGGERLFDSEGRVSLTARPNPFNATTAIEYEVIEAGSTELSVLDLLGRRVALLYTGVPEPGRYRIDFDASALSSGTYLGVLKTPSIVVTHVVVCVK